MSFGNRVLLVASRSTARLVQLVLTIVATIMFVLVMTLVATRTLVTSAGPVLLDRRRGDEHRVPRDLKARRRWSPSTRRLVAVVFGLGALALWCESLRWVDVGRMNDLGLVSVLPVTCYIALAALTLGFCMILSAFEELGAAAVVYVLALIVMLYLTPTLVEQSPRFDVTYWLAGHTEYVLRNGTVDPYLDAYFNWPGFFVLTGLLGQTTGVPSVLAIAPWASLAYNLAYLAPMYLIFTTITRDRRTVWLGLWFFYITDWVWQDYFAPQGLNLFLYLTIIAILLKGFATTRRASGDGEQARAAWPRSFSLPALRPRAIIARLPGWFSSLWAWARSIRPPRSWMSTSDFSAGMRRLRAWSRLADDPGTPAQRRKRIALLVTLIVVFALSVMSHPITPFFILLSVTALTVFGRITPRWLPILLGVMIVAWDVTAASPYLIGHLSQDVAPAGNLEVAASSNLTNRLAVGSPEHQLVSTIRILLTAAIWGLAGVGMLLRWRAQRVWAVIGAKRGRGGWLWHDGPFLLLVAAPGVLVVAQPYGGEMGMRYFLFTLPIISFFAAAAFRTRVTFLIRMAARKGVVGDLARWVSFRSSLLNTMALVSVCLLLLGGFMFARYGNENGDYVSNDELTAVAFLYSVAPPHSLLLAGYTGTPWRYRNLETFTYGKLPGVVPDYRLPQAEARDITAIVREAADPRYPAVYVIITRSQKAQAHIYADVPLDGLPQIEHLLLESGAFQLVYHNRDADILEHVSPPICTGCHVATAKARKRSGHEP